jgi:hypothetical protein
MDINILLQWLNALGQIFEIIGGVVLYFFAVPPYIPIARITQMGGPSNEIVEKRLSDRELYASRAKIGFRMLVIGFLLQFSLSTHVLYNSYNTNTHTNTPNQDNHCLR